MEKKRELLLPASILVAALLISLSLVYSAGKGGNTKTASLTQPETESKSVTPQPSNIEPVSSEDHILGSINAPLKIVEFSDLECPFCKDFHQTMKQIIEEYEGQVAWAYRHFPLDSIHSKARKEAEATECAAEQGGNDAFWSYVDRLFEITPSNNGLDLALLPQIAVDIGLNENRFQACLDSGKYADHVEADLQDGVASGGRGTPYSVIIAPDGETYSIPAALPLEQVRLIIDEIINSGE